MRILISRLSAVGDCILTMPVACAIRRAIPEAHISWLVQKGPSSLIEPHECVDETVVVPRGWLKSLSEIRRVRSALRQLNCDWVIDAQSLTKSAVAPWLARISDRAAFAPPQGRELAPWLATHKIVRTADHVVDAYLQLLRPLGIEGDEVEFRVPRPSNVQSRVDQWQRKQRLPDNYILMNPGAGWDSKIWPWERYGQLARRIEHQYGIRTVVVWAGPREEVWAHQIVELSESAAVMAPATSLLELAEVSRRATMFVGSDTGPLHLAAAVGTRCVGLYGTTQPSDCGPYGPGHFSLQVYYQAGSSRQRRQAANEAMRAITTDMVLNGVDTLWQQKPRSAA